MYFSKLELIQFFIFTVVILILPHLAIVVRWNTPFDSSIITKGRVPETDILLVINPLSPCTELYTIRSQRRYLLGVLSDNRRGRVLFWWLWWWRDCNTYCYDHPAQDNIVGKEGDPIIYSRKKKKTKWRKVNSLYNQQGIDTDCSIRALYKIWIFIDRLSRDN